MTRFVNKINEPCSFLSCVLTYSPFIPLTIILMFVLLSLYKPKIMKERRIAIEQAALHDKLAQQQQTSTSTGDASIDNVDLATSTTTPSSFVSSRKKPSAAERIGYRKGSGGAR